MAAMAACWWIDSHAPGEAFVLSTAPTAPQVRAVLWRNINRIHASAGLPGRCNQVEWLMPTGDDSEELVAIGRKPSEHSEGAFQGIHARYVLVILDESQGVPETLWTATESIASNKNARILAIGNPDLQRPARSLMHVTPQIPVERNTYRIQAYPRSQRVKMCRRRFSDGADFPGMG